MGQPEGGVALLQAAKAAERDAAAHRPSAAQKQQQIAELEERAVLYMQMGKLLEVLTRSWRRKIAPLPPRVHVERRT